MPRLALIPIALVAVLAACSPAADTAPVTVGGLEVDNAADLLEAAEDRPPQTPDVADRCFFTVFGDGSDIAPLLRCGPKGNADKARVGPWHAMELQATETADGITLSLADDFSIGWDLLPGERLLRPDDLEPISPEGLPLPVATAFARGVNSLVGRLPLDYQRCMAEAGWIVFEIKLLYDGMATKRDDEVISNIGHSSHRTLSWGPIDVVAEATATEDCVREIAAAAGLGFERDDGDVVPSSDG